MTRDQYARVGARYKGSSGRSSTWLPKRDTTSSTVRTSRRSWSGAGSWSASTGKMKITRLRRIVLLVIVGLFLAQFLGVKALVGGLSGSVAVWFVKLIDVFALDGEPRRIAELHHDRFLGGVAPCGRLSRRRQGFLRVGLAPWITSLNSSTGCGDGKDFHSRFP
ncbi:MAG: hypothetical protein MZV70_01080 [Desulfobacterales bacterium]|nr:hypothetical protein [Desulfobacterales bacterium]